jgi:hypothetical protein
MNPQNTMLASSIVKYIHHFYFNDYDYTCDLIAPHSILIALRQSPQRRWTDNTFSKYHASVYIYRGFRIP